MAKAKKTGKKKFFQVQVPLTAAKVDLYGYSEEEFKDKVVKIDMTRSLRGKNMELRAKISLVGDKLESEIISLQLLGSYIRKMMRRGTDYVEDSFTVTCKDATLKVKPFMITRKHVSRSIRASLRDNAKKFLESYMTIRTAKEIMSEVMTSKIQKELAMKSKKIYPLALCEIRMLELVREPETPKSK